MEGFNQWTVPWTTPEMPELDAIRAGNLEAPEFHIEDEQIEAYQRDGVLYLERAGESSPPFPDPGMSTGDRMREDWFPILWHR